MANYVSSLTGSQIDSVMQKIDQGVPEGYAVGEKNGVPVSSSSVYYHNNAKYYATNAQASAARAEAAVPASTAGAVFFDRSQSLTDAQKVQAKRNISAGSSNPNLLVNWWFADGLVINRRRATTGDFTSGAYRMDGWQTTFGTSASGGTWSLDNNGITITSTNGGVYFRQAIPNPTLLVGKQLTASVMLANGDIYNGSITRTSSTQVISHGLTGFWMGFESSNMFRFGSTTGTFTVKAVKLEVGGVSTLANDAPPTYAEELAKCVTSNTVTTDSYANQIIAPTSNPNLFDNPFFTVNQRILTTGTVVTSTYIRDRWKLARCTYTFDNKGAVTTTWDSSGSGAYLIQYMQVENAAILAGKFITISAYINNTLYSRTMRIPTASGGGDTAILGGGVTINITNQTGTSRGIEIQFVHSSTTGITIRSPKCELGTISTLAMDTPPNYTAELLKCQRYFQRIYGQTNNTIGVGHIYNNIARFMIPLGVPMRGTPTLAVQGTYNIVANGTKTAVTLALASSMVALRTSGFINVTAATSGLSDFIPCILSPHDNTDYLDLSSEP